MHSSKQRKECVITFYVMSIASLAHCRESEFYTKVWPQRKLLAESLPHTLSSLQAHLEGQEAAKKQMEKIIPSQVETLLEDKLAQAESGKAMALKEAIVSAEGRLRRAPIRDAPCNAEREQVALCYKTEKNALKCQDVVTAFSRCASSSADHLLEER